SVPVTLPKSNYPKSSSTDITTDVTTKDDNDLAELQMKLKKLQDDNKYLKFQLEKSIILLKENHSLHEDNKQLRYDIEKIKIFRLPEPTPGVYEWVKNVVKHFKMVANINQAEANIARISLPLSAEDVQKCYDNEDWKKTARNMVRACFPKENFSETNFSKLEKKHSAILNFLKAAYPIQSITHANLTESISSMC
ncbi:unnamed protein product, partial [Didymodactylos carnosus]